MENGSIKKNFYDKYANIKPNSWDKDSENPNLFNAYFWLLSICLAPMTPRGLQAIGYNLRNKYFYNGGILKTNEFDTSTKGNFLSIDESIGYAATCHNFSMREHLKYLNIVTSQTWFRFYDVIPSLMMFKYRWTRFLLFPYFFVAMGAFFSCLKKEEETSGKLLAFLELKSHNMKISLKICNYLLRNKGGFERAFRVYFPEYDHPINVLARLYFRSERDQDFF